MKLADRAMVFVDGNNWYHGLTDIGIKRPGQLNMKKVSEKLLGPREWVGTRYYVGQVSQEGNAALYAEQRRFLAGLKSTDGRISVHLGRLEKRSIENKSMDEVRRYLSSLPFRIERTVFRDLMNIAARNRKTAVWTEKAVDVMLAVDAVLMSERNEFDSAYLLTADGDFTPVADAVRSHGKKVYAASGSMGGRLAAAVDSFIRFERAWFRDCY